MWRRVVLFLALVWIGLAMSCREPTQLQVKVYSQVPCPDLKGIVINVGATPAAVAAEMKQSGSVSASSSTCAPSDRYVGDVYLVPGESAGAFAVRAGLRGTRPEDCVEGAPNCILLRRRFAYVEHRSLSLTVYLDPRCERVTCDNADQTCSKGKCVPSDVVCNGSECTAVADALPEPGDAGIDAKAVVDATGDAGAQQLELEVSVGAHHSCARLPDGSVKCWGGNDLGQLGLGDTLDRGAGPEQMGARLPPVDLGPGRTAAQISAGLDHTCARLDNGTVKCWGSNDSGKLGLGDPQPRGNMPGQMGAALPTVDLGVGRTALAISAGVNHTCAVLDDGSVKCWGLNTEGQLGLGDTLTRGDKPGQMGSSLPVLDLGAGGRAVQVSAGLGDFTCVTLDGGSVKCWGYDANAIWTGPEKRGDGPGQMGANLEPVALGRNALQVVAGNNHACARLDNGSVKCWGQNAAGELGLGNVVSRGNVAAEMGANLPSVDLGPERTAQQVSAGATRSCATLDDGTAKCWGININGELGLGDKMLRGSVPNQMGALLPAIDLGPGRTVRHLSAGQEHTCVALDDRSVKCWGKNARGALGLGDTMDRGGGPGQMGSNLPAVQLK